MPVPEPTEIIINEHNEESHPSWIMVRASRITSQPGSRLFDSEIAHSELVRVSVMRCTRTRDLQRDWLYARRVLIEFDMSMAQWGSFVSSFGTSGVPATLSWFEGDMIPRTPIDSRLNKSHEDVRNAASEAIKEVQKAHAKVEEAFARNAGKREMRDLIKSLGYAMGNIPSNLEFAAKSLSEHVENTVQKARADVEGMVHRAIQNNQQLDSGSLPNFELEWQDQTHKGE